jgi:hypothetical protein
VKDIQQDHDVLYLILELLPVDPVVADPVDIEALPSSGLQPTKQTYEELEQAFDHFNRELFEGKLPRPMLTLQRQANSYGYFSAHQFQNLEKQQAHEIALNPSYFIRPIQETLNVLVREMISLDQALHSEKPPRHRYRNKEWAAKCKAIGLWPSDTGQPGGKETGDGVLTYVIAGGPFDLACTKLLDDKFTLHWLDRYPPLATVTQVEAGFDDSLNHFMEGESHDDESRALAGEAAPHAQSPEVVNGSEVNGLIQGSAEDSALATLSAEGAPANVAQPQPKTAAAPPMKRFESLGRDQIESLGIEPKDAAKSASKSKFNCSKCNLNVWGKPSLRVMCIGPEEAEHAPHRMVFVPPSA